MILCKELVKNVSAHLRICWSVGDFVLGLLRQLAIGSLEKVNFRAGRATASAENNYLKCEC